MEWTEFCDLVFEKHHGGTYLGLSLKKLLFYTSGDSYLEPWQGNTKKGLKDVINLILFPGWKNFPPYQFSNNIAVGKALQSLLDPHTPRRHKECQELIWLSNCTISHHSLFVVAGWVAVLQRESLLIRLWKGRGEYLESCEWKWWKTDPIWLPAFKKWM